MDMKPSEFQSLVQQRALPQPVDIHGFTRWRVRDLEAIKTGEAMDDEAFEV